jgi:hypothetical protein
MFKQEKYSNKTVLDILELNELKKITHELLYNKDGIDLHQEYHKKLLIFFDWYIEYATAVLRNKKCSNQQISNTIFKGDPKTKKQLRDFLQAHLFLSKEYIKYLQDNVTPVNIITYNDAISSLLVDLEWVIASVEVHFKKHTQSIKLNSWRRKNLSPLDIYLAAKTLFFIENSDNIEQLPLRDLKPLVMFQIRQLLEVFGKNMIGYYAINNSNGNTVKKFTQVAWTFIQKEINNSNSRIEFPFDPHLIIQINKWSNSFIHTTHLYSNYIQFFALKAMEVLLIPGKKPIQIYSGKYFQNYHIADIKIKDYNSLKIDFESYLNDKISGITVEWMPLDKVGAYILNL